jgi:hypothetical protein
MSLRPRYYWSFWKQCRIYLVSYVFISALGRFASHQKNTYISHVCGRCLNKGFTTAQGMCYFSSRVSSNTSFENKLWKQPQTCHCHAIDLSAPAFRSDTLKHHMTQPCLLPSQDHSSSSRRRGKNSVHMREIVASRRGRVRSG